jgi:putative membrane protein
MEFVLVRYFHFLGILVLFAAIALEHMLVKREMTTQEIRRTAAVDLMVGISAGVVLLTGLSLWFLVGKPAEFYSSNPVFHTKVTLFVVAALLSIYPTVFLLRNRRTSAPSTAVPRGVVMVIRVELLLLAAIPLLAALMAQGYGLR